MTAIKSNYIMVFDVETTGLLDEKFHRKNKCYDIDNSPYVLQICFIIYDIVNNETVKTFSSYVDIHESVVIPPKATEVNGITKETCKTGMKIECVLAEFYNNLKKYDCDTIVGHNIHFDKNMIFIEIARHKIKLEENLGCINDVYNYINQKRSYCTMFNSIELCNLVTPYKNSRKNETYKKFPSLKELYIKLFGVVPGGLHDAEIDTVACLKCYLELLN
jgi:DNA polymerase III epsilon subunit-like protein